MESKKIFANHLSYNDMGVNMTIIHKELIQIISSKKKKNPHK